MSYCPCTNLKSTNWAITKLSMEEFYDHNMDLHIKFCQNGFINACDIALELL